MWNLPISVICPKDIAGIKVTLDPYDGIKIFCDILLKCDIKMILLFFYRS